MDGLLPGVAGTDSRLVDFRVSICRHAVFFLILIFCFWRRREERGKAGQGTKARQPVRQLAVFAYTYYSR